jgi:pimeloyl-CoA dehydrogenase
MHFELDTDEQQLRESLCRLLAAKAAFEHRREAVRSAAGWDRALWPALAELGVTSLTLPDAVNGFGLRPIAWLPVLQALGHALALQPFLPSAVLAATAIANGGTPGQQQELLHAIVQGSRVIGFAHDEPAARHSALWVDARAGAGVLNGAKHNVLYGADADTFIVSARTHGAPDEEQGLGLFVVDAAQPGVQRTALRLIDDTPAASIEFRGARAEPLGAAGSGWRVLRAALGAGSAAACAEALGVGELAYELTVDYVRTRQQFGRAIGANQAVRHRVAEMRVALEMLRSAAMAGLLALESEDAAGRARELSRARMLVHRHGGFITNEAIQLHGGIGMTLEYAVGHCLRRHTVLDQLFGDGPAHAARVGAAIAQVEPSE